jgi:hypothetical protein
MRPTDTDEPGTFTRDQVDEQIRQSPSRDTRSPSLCTFTLLRARTERSHEHAARGKRQDAARDAAEQNPASRSAPPAAANDYHFGAVFRRGVQNLLPRWPAPDQRLDADPTARRARCSDLLGELSEQPGSRISARVRARLVFVDVYQRDICTRVLREAECALERLFRAVAEVGPHDDPSLTRHALLATALAPRVP